MTIELSACPLCDSVSLVESFVEHTERRRDGSALNYRAPVTHCSTCGESFATPAQARAGDVARADALRTLERALAPTAIRALRTLLGLTQSDFETFLCTGQKTAVRWENGTVVPGRLADLLLRVLTAVPEARAFCSAYTGVVIAPSAQPLHVFPANAASWFLMSPLLPSTIGFAAGGGVVVRETGPPFTDTFSVSRTESAGVSEPLPEGLWQMTRTGEFRSPRILPQEIV